MSRRYEDFDEYCDPENPRSITYEDVVRADHRIKQHLPVTPLLTSHYQREFAINLFYKLESIHKTGSFKERGALNLLEQMTTDKKKLGIVLASLGNQAVGICYHAAKFGIPVVVVMPNCVPISKLQRCTNLGAKVTVQGHNLAESQRYARAIARDKGMTYVNGRDHPHILAGYGTVALEILNQVPDVDAVIVPVGSGGLVAGIATVIKHVRPSCVVYGVQSEKMPVFYKSLEHSDPVSIPIEPSLAEAICVSNVGVNAFHTVQPLLDKMLLVDEDWIARAILHLIEKERLVVEGSAACSLATIIGNLVPELKLKKVVCVLTGGNIDLILLARSLDRGLAAEGRLVKFKVGIKDSSVAHARLLRILADGGYNLLRQFPDHVWIENEFYTVEMKIVCQTRGLEHALELKRIIERVYPNMSEFETEPFNDKRTCPCYIKNS